MTPEDTFNTLLSAGLKHADRDLIVLFDSLDADDPAFAKKARELKPALFHEDVRAGYKADLAAVTRITRSPSQPTPGINALDLTDREYENELRRMGHRTATYGAGPNRFKRGR